MKNNEPLPRFSRNALTLVELLLVVVMMAMVSLALYATLSKGIDIWRRSAAQDGLEELNIFFEKFSVDLRNAFVYRTIGFSGKEDELEFASLVANAALQVKTVGKVAYRFTDKKNILLRQQRTISQLYLQEQGARQEVLRNVVWVKFRYYSFDTKKQEYVWSREWLQEGLPLAVSVGIGLREGSTQGEYVRTVSIPARQ